MFLSKLVKFVYRILWIMILLLLVSMVIKVIKNDVLFSIQNLLKFSIVGVGVFLFYKIPFSFVINKAKRENRTLSTNIIRDVLLINYMLFALELSFLSLILSLLAIIGIIVFIV